MVELNAVEKVYPGDVRALEKLNLKAKRGETLCLIGPSGSGKSTLLKMINRLVEPSSGEVLVNNQDIRKLNPFRLRREIGYVSQSGDLFPHLTVAQNVSLVAELEGWSKKKRESSTLELLALVGLDDPTLCKRYPSELSGGQAQRVGIARALMMRPELILMDEPFGSLDPMTRGALQDQFIRLKRRLGKTVVMVTHDLEEAFHLGDQIAVLKDGALIQCGTEQELRQGAASQFIIDFLSSQKDKT